jgi:single-strand DNA-binding protein
MNQFNGIGRLTKDPEIRSTNNGKKVARYTIAIDRQGEGADFIPCIAWEKGADFVEKFLHKGMKIGVTGRIQTGNYKDKEGRTVYTTDLVVTQHYFCEGKAAQSTGEFMDIPDGQVAELPFN